MIWPFRQEPRAPSRNGEIERLQLSVSEERGQLYKSLFKLDSATHHLEEQGVRGMFAELFRHLDEAKNNRD